MRNSTSAPCKKGQDYQGIDDNNPSEHMAVYLYKYIFYLLLVFWGSSSFAQNIELKSGAYIGTDVKSTDQELAKSPMMQDLLNSARENLENSYVIYDSQTGEMTGYTPDNEEPEISKIDFENNLITEKSGETIPFRVEDEDQFVVFGVGFDIEITFKWVDQNSDRFKTNKKNYQEAQAKKRERKEAIKNELVALSSPKEGFETSFAIDYTRYGLPYIFNIPTYWTVRDHSSTVDKPTFYALDVSIEPFQNVRMVGSALENVKKAYEKRKVQGGLCHQTDYNDPSRSFVICYDTDFDEFTLTAFIDHEDDQASMWLLDSKGDYAKTNIENVVLAFQSVRTRSKPNENQFSVNPDDWPDFEMDTKSQSTIDAYLDGLKSTQKLIDLINSPHLSSFGGDASIGIKSSQLSESKTLSVNYSVLSPEQFHAIDGDRRIAFEAGKIDDGLIRFYTKPDDACLAVVTFPITGSDGNHISDLYLGVYGNRPFLEQSHNDDRGNCVALWKTLRAYKATRADLEIKTELSKNAYEQIAKYEWIHRIELNENILYRVVNPADDTTGIINQNGDIIIPLAYDSISVEGKFLEAETASGGEYIFDSNGNAVLSGVWEDFQHLDDPKGFYIASNRKPDNSELLVLNGDTGKILFRGEYSSIDYIPEHKRWIATTPGEKKQLLDFEGNKIGEQFKRISNLSGTPNYLVETDEGEDVITDGDLTPVAGPFTTVWEHQTPKLFFVNFAKNTVGPNEATSAYYDYFGNRITPPDMSPVYAPSDDGYITVKQAGAIENPKWGLLDRNGKLVLPLEYDKIHMEREGVVPVAKNRKFGLYSIKDGMLTKFLWKNVTLSQGHAVMALKETRTSSQTKPKYHWMLIDWHGNPISDLEFQIRSALQIPLALTYTDPETEQEIPVFLASWDGKFGLIGSDGQIILPNENELNCTADEHRCYKLIGPNGEELDNRLKL